MVKLYQELPGHKLTHHDSFEFVDENSEIIWWHHADDPLPASNRFKTGSTCSTSLTDHYPTEKVVHSRRHPLDFDFIGLKVSEFVEKFLDKEHDSSMLTINPSIVCGACGRHMWYQLGIMNNFGEYNAHEKRDLKMGLEPEVTLY